MIVVTDLSVAQHIPFGRVVAHLYYNNATLLNVVEERRGYPHNGGEHTLVVEDTADNTIAFLELIAEHYKNVPFANGMQKGVNREIDLLIDAVKEAPVQFGKKRVTAKKLFSQHRYDYQTVYTYKDVDGVLQFHPTCRANIWDAVQHAISHLKDIAFLDEKTSGVLCWRDHETVIYSDSDDVTVVFEHLKKVGVQQ